MLGSQTEKRGLISPVWEEGEATGSGGEEEGWGDPWGREQEGSENLATAGKTIVGRR